MSFRSALTLFGDRLIRGSEVQERKREGHGVARA
jgi:hypothetical protein